MIRLACRSSLSISARRASVCATTTNARLCAEVSAACGARDADRLPRRARRARSRRSREGAARSSAWLTPCTSSRAPRSTICRRCGCSAARSGAHHPEAVIHLALADERPPWLRVDGRALRRHPGHRAARHPGLASVDVHAQHRRALHGDQAVRAQAPARSCRTAATVLYFDPDMVLFSRVDDILATLETANLALTPHQTKPEHRRSRRSSTTRSRA